MRLQYQKPRQIIPDCESLWRYLAVLAKDNKIPLLAAGGTKNHVHLLMGLPPVFPLAKFMKQPASYQGTTSVVPNYATTDWALALVPRQGAKGLSPTKVGSVKSRHTFRHG